MWVSLFNVKFIVFIGILLLNDDKYILVEFGGDIYIDEYCLYEVVVDGVMLFIKY